MDGLKKIKTNIKNLTNRLQDNSFDGLLWFVNIITHLLRFIIRGDKLKAISWVMCMILLFYVYGAGTSDFLMNRAKTPSEFIKSFVNVSILILTANNNYWFITYGPQLESLVNTARENDDLCRQSQMYQKRHEQLLKAIKRILLIFYGVNVTDGILYYIPHRVDFNNDYCMSPCVGLEPLTSTPNREICSLILCLQEMSVIAVCLNYQALVLFLIAHTAAMYQLLSEEIMELNNIVEDDIIPVKDKLSVIICRHVLTLETVDKLKNVYSMSIGINFASNAVCTCLFFFLSLEEYYSFTTILFYCFATFFLYCFFCQKLVDASEEFERAVYSCGWENFTVRERRSVYIMLLQAQQPVTLLAGDVLPVNIATFASTCQAIYKFVTVFKV